MCVNVLYQIYYGDQLVYLGRTRQPIDRRLHGHFFQKPMHKKLDARAVSRVRVAKVATQADMFLYEIYYINKLKPALNCDDKAQDELTIELPELCWLEYDPRLLPKWSAETEKRERAAKERLQREIEENLKALNERRARHGRPEMTMDEYLGNTKTQEVRNEVQ
ncbi:MAG: hypothetical protein PHI98_01230 [Eubacteriales bacterium]|nr:hypothetical protein [Eubacteriales bacterium]